MLRAAVALLCLLVVQTKEMECSDSTSCNRAEADASSMLQLGRLGAQQSSVALLKETATPLIIDEDGVKNTYYLTSPNHMADIIDDGMTVKFTPPYRYYLMKEATTDYSKAENFYKPDFMGKTFTVDIDFKKDGPGCGCNLNFYLVDMPWPTAGKDNDYYCDAQCFEGLGCCAEFDMNEGSKEVQQITNHACTGVGTYNGHPNWACNKWGDPELKTHPNDFSPGPGHTIDSDKPLTWTQKFEMQGDDFVFTTTMTQGDKEKTLTMGPGNAQLNVMAGNISKGMAFVTGYWFAPDMNWLDGEECGQGTEHCNKNPAYISNWRITTNGKPVPAPGAPSTPPAPAPPAPAPVPSPAPAPVAPAPPGGIIIDEDGVKNTYYLTSPNKIATTIDNGMTVKYEPPYRFYLMNKNTQDYSKSENFYKPDFMGKTFTVDFDFKKDGAGCGCNLNFYLVDMPWPTAGKDNDYYCDAQCFEGLGCCSEFDMNEGNKEVQQVTNHACTGVGSYNGHPDWACNKWGDPELKTHAIDFSPGPGHTIDSDLPFTWTQKFEMQGDDFVFTTTMTQGDKKKTLTMGPGNAQLNFMAKNITKGMAFVTGYWFAPDMNWLDGEECGQGVEHCSKNPAYLSNWRITTNGNPVPTPPTPPPAPSPPAPAPAPAGSGHCCWGGSCGVGCDSNPGAWCNKDAGTCQACGGQYCS